MNLSVSIVLPVMDESDSLRETVRILMSENAADIREIICVTSARSTAQALEACKELAEHWGPTVWTRTQERPFLGGALQDAFDWATGTHVLLMASDLETDPHSVKELIAKARTGFDIVTATRWARGGGFDGYSVPKYCLNFAFQKLFGLLYGTRLSDLTFGFRLFKADWVKSIAWQECKHAFLLETLLKPLRLGASVAEIGSPWRARPEGISHNELRNHIAYFRVAIEALLCPRHELLKEDGLCPRAL